MRIVRERASQIRGAAWISDDLRQRLVEIARDLESWADQNSAVAGQPRIERHYASTCAVTGLKIINGGGRAEAQAAHIWSVEEGGPDVVQNGLALSATAHWLFDRHLISLDDQFRLLVSHNKVPGELTRLFPASGQSIRLPQNQKLYPDPAFVARHRDRFVAHN